MVFNKSKRFVKEIGKKKDKIGPGFYEIENSKLSLLKKSQPIKFPKEKWVFEQSIIPEPFNILD